MQDNKQITPINWFTGNATRVKTITASAGVNANAIKDWFKLIGWYQLKLYKTFVDENEDMAFDLVEVSKPAFVWRKRFSWIQFSFAGRELTGQHAVTVEKVNTFKAIAQVLGLVRISK